MLASRRAPYVALLTLLQHRFPGLDDPARLIKQGAVLVNGVPAASTRTRAHGSGHPDPESPMPAGTIKLARALPTFWIHPAGAVALDMGAAGGGFTQALLDAGAAGSTPPSTPAPASSAGGCAPTLRDQRGTHQPGPARPAHHR